MDTHRTPRHLFNYCAVFKTTKFSYFTANLCYAIKKKKKKKYAAIFKRDRERYVNKYIKINIAIYNICSL